MAVAPAPSSTALQDTLIRVIGITDDHVSVLVVHLQIEVSIAIDEDGDRCHFAPRIVTFQSV